MTIRTIDEALAYLSRDPKSVEAECAGVLREAIGTREEVVQMAEGRESLAMRREFESEAVLERVRALPGKWRKIASRPGGASCDSDMAKFRMKELANELEAALSGKVGK